jgi:type III restriction enzyme
MQPDLIFIAQGQDGALSASIVEPHSHHLADALAKLIGLVDFAERHGAAYQRIDSLAKRADGTVMLLDMRDQDVRAGVRTASSAADLYDGPSARTYS